MNDQFFTPDVLARQLAEALRDRRETVIADFAAGDGELLRAASARWPTAEIVGIDIDRRHIRRMTREHPGWQVGVCDFLSAVSRRRSSILSHVHGKASLVILNPPFSCRGGQRFTVDVDDISITCGRAMAFVLHAVPYLARRGRLVAILPAGSPASDKDSTAWEWLRKTFNVRFLSECDRKTFAGCAARAVMVSMEQSTGRKCATPSRTCTVANCNLTVTLVRGVTAMHAARNGLKGDQWPMVHTTDLNDKAVSNPILHLKTRNRTVVGPCVLIPRVGKPSIGKCALYLRRRRLVLSDCLVGLQCRTSAEARELHAILCGAWDDVSAAYSGTGAPYITVATVRRVLGELGVTAVIQNGP